jgi:hypothetical protein
MPHTLHNWIALKEKTARCCRLAKQNGEVQVIVSCSRPATNSWFAGCRIATCELGMLHDLFKRLRFLSGCVFRTLIRATESFSYRLWNKGILKELNLLVFFWGGDEVKGPLQIWTFFLWIHKRPNTNDFLEALLSFQFYMICRVLLYNHNAFHETIWFCFLFSNN